MTKIVSYNFFHQIQNLLCNTYYPELSNDFVNRNLDNRVAAGPKALDLTLSRLKKTIMVLEPLVDKMKGKPKSKGVHVIGNQEDAMLKGQEREVVYAVDSQPAQSGKWWSNEFRFPCPIKFHSYELSQCTKFLTMTPRERQEALGMKICKTCFKPGGGLYDQGDQDMRHDVLRSMVCPGCTAFAQGKSTRRTIFYFVPANILPLSSL